MREIVGWGALIVVLASLAWILRGAGVRGWRTALVLLLAVPPSVFVLNEAVCEGDLMCLDCGRVHRSVRLFGIPMPFTAEDVTAISANRAYERAFPDVVPADHPHGWETVGCTYYGFALRRTVKCREFGPCAWYRDLPLLADRELASATAARFASLGLGERVQVLTRYHPWFDSTTPAERFSDWRSRWKPLHPDWP